jgi:hypothetical protein
LFTDFLESSLGIFARHLAVFDGLHEASLHVFHRFTWVISVYGDGDVPGLLPVGSIAALVLVAVVFFVFLVLSPITTAFFVTPAPITTTFFVTSTPITTAFFATPAPVAAAFFVFPVLVLLAVLVFLAVLVLFVAPFAREHLMQSYQGFRVIPIALLMQ